MLKWHLHASGGPGLMGKTASASKLIGSPQAPSGESPSSRGWWGSWHMGRRDPGPGLMREKTQVPVQGGGVQWVGLEHRVPGGGL